MKPPLPGRSSTCPPRQLTRRIAAGARLLSALLLTAFALVAVPAPVHALTVLTRDFDGLVARAETIFKGTVVNQESLWLGEGANRHIATRVTFQVLETFKGVAGSSQTLEFLGGTVDGKTLRVPGVPRFAAGETVILFVVGNGEQVCPLVGAFQGRFTVEKAPVTAEERMFSHDHRPVTRTAAIGQGEETTVSSNATSPRAKAIEPGTGSAAGEAAAADAPALTAAQFGAAIAEKLRERATRGLPAVQKD